MILQTRKESWEDWTKQSVHGFSLAEWHQENKGVFLLPVELCYHQSMWGWGFPSRLYLIEASIY